MLNPKPSPSAARRSAPEDDRVAAGRKADHIELALASRVADATCDARFTYEPLLAAHPAHGSLLPVQLAGYTLRAPIWVSSMTGGTERAQRINHHLARACGEFGLGMGLGSCRALLYDERRLADFNVRDIMGSEVPLFANLGVAQVEQLLAQGETWRIDALCERLHADGLIVHVNPLQEWLQPEGDRFTRPPIETIEELLSLTSRPLMVKEVGQGMGPLSLERLLALPLAALEFAAAGGTNFSRLELLRSSAGRQAAYAPLGGVGHTAAEMVEFVNAAARRLGERRRCGEVIISGGVTDFLDGHYLRAKCQLSSVYGQASAFLEHAQGDYSELQTFVAAQIRGLELAAAYLIVR